MAAMELEKFQEAYDALTHVVTRFSSQDETKETPWKGSMDSIHWKRMYVGSILKDQALGFRIVQLVAGKDFSVKSHFSPKQW
ncbi:hypothetical protein HMI54_005788 [Coelomomyces lativittatus]|nr:hypothetical protein HMI54_005788 [Coelomomyces lativittatus]